ncbi:acyl-CoA dehydrogenase family protein [Brevibacillus formosus]|nr:acyl-CoA dehydrogenase family protein [Brevibacillus formosus]KLI00274.1 acyl-CoA dehydrogenase [Brevibacillus formosus]MED1958632.1 acyl-CoA dehydrogenase family protein [Brevibacillus formosus]PSJ99208.1 acyl-CoA dehydrogenase [Brevibacillus formosus]
MKITSPHSILEEVRQFIDEEIRPYAADFEKQQALPRELIKKMGNKRYLAASFSEQYGGLQLHPLEYGSMVEEIGKGALSAAMLLTVTTGLVGETLIRWGTEYQKEQYVLPIARGEKIGAFALTEPGVGSGAKDVQTSYEKVGDKYRITGRKKWISFGEIADFFIVIASDSSGNGISAFIVDCEQEGVRVQKIQGLLSCAASQLADIELTNVEVGSERLIGKERMGFTGVANFALDQGRFNVAWMGVGLAQEALEVMVTYARKRTQSGEKIFNFQLIKGIIGDATTNVHAARSLCKEAARMRADNHPDAIVQTTMAKYFSSVVANKVASDAVQVLGANGCCNLYPVERLFREAKVLEIIEGSSQIQQQIIAMHAANRHYQPKRVTGL